VGQGRVELPTSRLSGVRSNHLSYWPGQALGRKPWPGRVGWLCCSGAGVPRTSRGLAPWKLNRTLVTVGLDLVVSVPWRVSAMGVGRLLRKEVIQPQVPLRLPCYDFTPVTVHSLGPCLLAVGAGTSGANDSHGVTGGVYKARERIHRCLLISDY
jgi:hypothetical protein